jgi:hypothetical protein
MRLTGSMRVTKRSWYAYGGFRSNDCWRRQVRGAWQYFIQITHY